MGIPERLFCWNFQTKEGGWEKGWGGYARQAPLTPMDDRERNTGAVFVRFDISQDLLRDAIEVLRQIDSGGAGGKVFDRDDCIKRLRKSVAAMKDGAA